MSRSTPFFNGSQPVKYHRPIAELQFKELHWTEQLRLKPLRDQPRKTYEQGDSHQNKWDMDLEDYDNFKETTT